ncbi:MAG: aldo/keto reductase [Myxococcota bacterium]|nr:aldo/keto reductase [Myxococcota bacterium]
MHKTNPTKPPGFLYGTAWKEEDTKDLTLLALQTGFRGMDTANQRKHYFEAAVGEGIVEFLKETETSREDLFLQTKFTYQAGQDHRLPYNPNADYSTQVKESFASSLEHLQTDYIDSYVLHGPRLRQGLDDADIEVWAAMETFQEQGSTKVLGVSNVNAEQLSSLFQKAEVKPAFVQNRCYAHMGWDKEVRIFCQKNHIVYQGFSLLTANRQILAHPAVEAIATREQKTSAQIIFAFALHVGMLPLTGTSSQKHMQEDLAATASDLSTDDVNLIENLAL